MASPVPTRAPGKRCMLEELFGYGSSMEDQETESVKRRVPPAALLPAIIVVVLLILLVIGFALT